MTPTANSRIVVETPEKVLFLYEPHRHKILYGGRDGIKSWSIARALLTLGTQRPLRILCARETQQSIRESVHQLLGDQIKMLGLREFYDVLEYTIRSSGRMPFPTPTEDRTEIIFAGLRNLSVEQIKSFESIDIFWIEEAAGVTRKSWQTLIPTARKAGSEIWVSFNPDLATDDTYVRWVLHPPPAAKVVQTSYLDNAWLSDESKDEIKLLFDESPDEADWIYGGATRSTVEGAIYRAEIAKAEQEHRITTVPYDATLPVRTFWDLGWSDLVSIWFVQHDGFRVRVIDYHQDRFKTSDHYLQVLQSKGYTYSHDPDYPAIVWPWDAASKMHRDSTESAMRAKGFTLRILPQIGKMQGIEAVRRMFPMMWFDAERCAPGMDGDGGKGGLRRYQWGVEGAHGRTQKEPLHDISSHPADALRTMAMDFKSPVPEPQLEWHERPYAGSHGSDGWMA